MIPIQNLYYLLLYAWDALDEGEISMVGADPKTSRLDLLAAVLNRGIDRLLRRGLDRGYISRREVIPGVRGKLDLSATVKGGHLPRMRTVCDVDDLTHDVVHNQLLKATVRELLRVADLDKSIHESLKETFRRLHDVSDIRLADRGFASVQLHRNNRAYRFLLDVCRLLYDCLVPDESGARMLFRDFLRDEERMGRLFERFLRNFYHHEQSTFRVGREYIQWLASGSLESLEYLPRMETDICLTTPTRKIVVDAKWYRDPLGQRFGKPTVRSGHLYQLFAYLRNISPQAGSELAIEGLLLYPTVSEPFHLEYQMHGHRIRVCTIDLNQHWSKVKRDLLGLLSSGTADV